MKGGRRRRGSRPWTLFDSTPPGALCDAVRVSGADSPQQDDQSFAHDLAAAEPHAVLTFEARYRPLIRHAIAVARARWGEAQGEADDARRFAADLFSGAGERLRDFHGEVAFGAWLYVAALRFHRGRTRPSERSNPPPLVAALPRRGDNADWARRAAAETEALRRAAQQLPPVERLWARMLFAERMTAVDAARALGRTPTEARLRRNALVARIAGSEADRASVQRRLSVLDLRLPASGGHPDAEAIAALAAGQPPPPGVAAHVAAGDACVELLAVSAAGLGHLAERRGDLAPLLTARPAPEAPSMRPAWAALIALVVAGILVFGWLGRDPQPPLTVIEPLARPAASGPAP